MYQRFGSHGAEGSLRGDGVVGLSSCASELLRETFCGEEGLCGEASVVVSDMTSLSSADMTSLSFMVTSSVMLAATAGGAIRTAWCPRHWENSHGPRFSPNGT
mmetsp:Transcript_84732/g.265066  ORF Transcript_84732/g.265066 Transcript_84732/m.265066 type:complete len:103 (+) Transcript_84732:1201-1509(+)